MRILVADDLEESALERLQALGNEVDARSDLTAAQLPSAISDFEALIVRSTEVTRDTMDASDHLNLIIRAGTGTDNIDTEAAARRGIYVCNVPGKNAIAVAELVMGLILAIDRRIPEGVAELREGRWDKTGFSNGNGLFGRTIGIVGLGEIGMAVAERAAAFGLRVLAIRKPGRPPEILERSAELSVTFVPDLDTLASSSDILSLHVPVTDDVKSMIDARLLSLMRPQAILINTARGELIDEAALIEAMNTKGIRCGLDAYQGEPHEGRAEFRSALAQHPNTYGTHHIGASTRQAQEAVANQVVAIVELYAEGTILNCVNLEEEVLGATTISVRHFDEVGVLSEVFATLKNADINVEQMQNRIFSGARAAVATMHVSGPIGPGLQTELESIDRVIGVSVTHRTEEQT